MEYTLGCLLGIAVTFVACLWLMVAGDAIEELSRIANR